MNITCAMCSVGVILLIALMFVWIYDNCVNFSRTLSLPVLSVNQSQAVCHYTVYSPTLFVC